jgi:hypothetical protein
LTIINGNARAVRILVPIESLESFMTVRKGLIPAEIWSANLAIKAKFDAALWFERAGWEEVGALAACGWIGRGDDEPFVRFFVPLEEEAGIVVDYARKTRTNVMFSIDEYAAIAWIRQKRPHLITALSAPLLASPGAAKSPQYPVGSGLPVHA